MAKFLLFTKGSYGDFIPFLALGAALKSRGNDVTLITHCHYELPTTEAGLEFVACDAPEEYTEFIRNGYLLDSPIGLAKFAKQHIFPTLCLEFELLSRYCDSSTILIVRHMSSIAAWFIAEARRLPLVSVFIAVAQANCLDLLVKFCRTFGDRDINGARQSLALPPIADWEEWTHQPALFAGCWPEWFAAPTPSWPPNVVPLGFLRHDASEGGPLPDEALEFLEAASPPPILITGGTAVWALGERFYSAASEGCALSGRRAMLVCRHDNLIPCPLPSGIVSFRFLPFATLVPRVSAIIHHGGTSVLVRGLIAGIPQVCLPYGADRPDTARRLEKLGVAKTILPKDWNAQIVAAALKELLLSPGVQKRCQAAQRLMDSSQELDRACSKFEALDMRNQVASHTGTNFLRYQ
jgi:rhamnosyltransferase subunit B